MGSGEDDGVSLLLWYYSQDWLDRDGNLLLFNDPFKGLSIADGRWSLPEAPGLGVAKTGAWKPGLAEGRQETAAGEPRSDAGYYSWMLVSPDWLSVTLM